MTAEDIESAAFGSAFRDIDPARPVLVTSLARAGTTMMLEVLSGLPGLAATTYRDMPFVLAPILWSKVAAPFRTKGDARRERAHGDGVEIGPDSPEGFEEVFWKGFWPGHYGRDRIRPWTAADAKPEATAFLRRHMQKVIALHRPGSPGARYLSKNNANIARLDLLPAMLPDASILLVLREPLEHAHSLHRQHANFAAMQGGDPFVARYMGDIGHYEFGSLHKAIAFPEFETLRAGRGPESPDYWLALWIAAFAEVLARRDRLVLAPYEALSAGGAAAFAPLLELLGLGPADQAALPAAAAHLRPPRPRADPAGFDPALVARARELHRALRAG
jgi:hypothetical protein